jgi:arylsulfatase A-like enzyme
MARPTNLLFIFADQMRAQALGCSGNSAISTPYLDGLASEGVRATNAVSSFPVCCPYRASLLTGNHVFRNGMYFNDILLPEHNHCVGSMYSDAGYATGYVGKWHLDGPNRWGYTPPGWRRRGFDDYWAVCNCDHSYFNAFYYTESPDPIEIDGYEPDHQTELAMEFVRDRRDDSFCLFLSYGTPHNPLVSPDEWAQRYDPLEVPLRPNVEGDHRADIAAYYSMISNLDWNVGRLVDLLRELEILDDTLVVFTSDHGDMLGSQNQERKQRPWEESIMVPFIARGPGLPASTETDVLLTTVDVLPTVLALTGTPGPDDMDGIDLSARLRGEDGPDPESAYIMDVCAAGEAMRYELPEWRGVRTKTHTYTCTRDGGWLLYDNARDPYQRHNLIDDPSARGVRADLEAMVDGHREALGDEFREAEHYLEIAKQAGPDACPDTLRGVTRDDLEKGVSNE